MPKSTGTTLDDVARRAGVSKNAVSVVINGSRVGTRVSEATRQRIRAAAAELGYKPNAIARSLRTQRTDVIGFYSGYGCLTGDNVFLSEIVGGIQMGCNAHGKDLLMIGDFHRSSVEDTYAKLVNRQVDALVMLSQYEDPLTDRMADSHLPVVAIANLTPNLPCVAVDDAQGGRFQAEHLAARGHETVLYRLPSKEYDLHKMTSVLRRVAAFEETARGLGMAVIQEREAMVDYSAPGWNFTLTDRERAVLSTPQGERPTAVVCWSDLAAQLFVGYCAGHGIQVPGDLAVVGFDGFRQWSSWDTNARPLTTIDASWPTVATKAVDLVLDKLNGNEIPAETLLPVTMRVGETT